MQLAIASARFPLIGVVYKFAPEDSSGGDKNPSRDPRSRTGEPDDLPYKVEIWDDENKAVEQVLAMTANPSIGYAAYFEAAKEYPRRYVVLRHKHRIVARWNPSEG
jgi:hypothetical protein